MFYLPSILAGTVLLAGVILFRKMSLGRRKVPPWAAFLCAGAAVLGGLGCVAVFDPVTLGLPSAWLAPQREAPPEESYHEGPLPAGEKFPSWEAGGWLNGPPPEPGSPGIRLIVLDVWAQW
jgi:hypothetical protein